MSIKRTPGEQVVHVALERGLIARTGVTEESKFALARMISRVAYERDDDIEFVWRWIDRMARGEISADEALSVLTHYPGAPEWVRRYTSVSEKGEDSA